MPEFRPSHESEASFSAPTAAEIEAAERLLDPKQNLQWDMKGVLEDSVKEAEQELDATKPDRYKGTRELRLQGFAPRSHDEPLQPGEFEMQKPEPKPMTKPAPVPELVSQARLRAVPENVAPSAEETRKAVRDEQADRLLIEVIRNTIRDVDKDPQKLAGLVAEHRGDAQRLMEDGSIKAADVVTWLKEAIQKGERRPSGYQQAARAEREFLTDPMTLTQAAKFTELVGMTDMRQRDLGAIGLIAEMAADELGSAITDIHVQEIAEHLKPVLDNTLKIFPNQPEASVESLRGTVKSFVAQRRRQRGEAPDDKAGGII